MQNNLLSVWGTIGSVALAVLILLAMITIHELGHYLAGKIFHFKINEFSIGFGPALFKRKSKKSGELFAVRLIPLGGYCAFEGEDGLDEESPKKKKDEPVFSEEGFDEAPKEEEPKKQIDPNAFTKKPCWQRIIVLIAGAFMNYLLAVLLITICFASYGQSLVAVGEVAPSDQAEFQEYGLQDQDILLKVNGKSVYLVTDVAKGLKGKKQGDMVEIVVRRVTKWKTDENGEYELLPNGWKKAEAREQITQTVMLRSEVNVKNSTEMNDVWEALGVNKTEDGNYLLANATVKFGFFQTIGHSFVYSFKIAGSILKVLGELFTGRLGISAVGGPVSTITMTSQIVSRGFRYFLEIAGYIGVNLAVFNLLPIPALDGCKVVFTAIEWVRGKPISRKVEAIINVIGFFFLLGFAVLVDILQFII